jgi:hypothetical protein
MRAGRQFVDADGAAEVVCFVLEDSAGQPARRVDSFAASSSEWCQGVASSGGASHPLVHRSCYACVESLLVAG